MNRRGESKPCVGGPWDGFKLSSLQEVFVFPDNSSGAYVQQDNDWVWTEEVLPK